MGDMKLAMLKLLAASAAGLLLCGVVNAGSAGD